MRVGDKIDEIFQASSGSHGIIELKQIIKIFWSTLNNAVSLVDLAGVFSVSIPSSSINEALTREMFQDFFRAFARMKIPSGLDFSEKLLDELRQAKSQKSLDNAIITSISDKSVIRVFLKYDLPLRRAFATFCGQAVRVGSIVSWDEVKSLSLGMEIDGFLAFAGAYSLVPQFLSSQQCELLFREVLTKYNLLAGSQSLGTSILYPQFQLLMAMVALEKTETQAQKNEKSQIFAKKSNDGKAKSLSDCLQELFRDIGISKFDESMSFPLQYGKTTFPTATPAKGTSGPETNEPGRNLFSGSIITPATEQIQDLYTSTGNHLRQSMILRLEHLFDEMEAKLITEIDSNNPVLALLSNKTNEELLVDSKNKLPTKPVVLADPVPVPSECPQTVEQLLEAALAYHNQGSFEESLKFLEAARIQMAEITEKQILKKKHALTTSSPQSPSHTSSILTDQQILDIQMYIILCKGNVYQSSGDDEQSLLQYFEGWRKAKEEHDRDWEIICINSAGILAFFNLRYDVAMLCFQLVHEFREQEYSQDSSDTATALNNIGCCLFCLNKRGEARIRFEKAWNVMTKDLGHRAPRAVTVWKNLEKSRRSQAPLQNKQDLKDSIQMRPDADRLLIGGTFTIQALPPIEQGGKKKKKGGGKKKKK